MSDLLNKASLVVIPSGYKEDTVYSVVPSDGAGDLSFTRASNGTRINSAGLVEVCPWNLIPNSQTFAIWNTVQISNTITVTDNFTTAPNGTLTAAKVVFNTFDATGQIFQDYVLAPTQNLTATLYAKVPSGTKQAYFGFYDGNVKTQLKTLTTEWQRIEYTGSIDASTIRACWFYGDGGASNVEVHLWGGQVNVGSTAKPYFPTTDRLNVPRLTYQNGGGGCPSLLLEPQRTNVCLWSEQINNAGWAKTNAPTITTNIATAPDGYGGADGIQDTTGGAFKRVRQTFSVAANGTHTASVFVKKETSETNYGGIALVFSNRWAYGIIDAVNGTLTVSSDSIIASSSTKVEDYGTYWRFSLTVTDNQSNTTLEIAYYGTLSVNGTTTGNSAGSVRTVWGFQVEVGATYATSYIPTLSTSVTRVADACFKTGISSLIGQTEGVLFADFVYLGETQSEVIDISDGTEDNRVMCYITSVGLFQIYVTISGSTDGFINTSFTPNVGSRYKIAVGYKLNDIIFYVNGTSLGTDTSTTIPATSKLTISNGGASNYLLASQFNQAVLFPTRLTNAELASLTTI